MKGPVVLHLIQGLSLTGGTPAKLFTLVSYSKHQHIVFCCENELNRKNLSLWKKQCTVIQGMRPNRIGHNVSIIKDIVKEYGVNIIHVYFPPETFLCGFLKIRFPNIRFVRSFEGNFQLCLFKRILTNWALSKFDRAVYISNYIGNCYAHSIPKRLVRKGLVIYNSASREPKDKNVIHHDVDKKRLLYVAGLNIHKNPLILVDVVKILRARGVDVHLDYVGDGPLRLPLENKIKREGLSDCVTLQGYCDNVVEFLNDCSVYLHPADNEGFGIAVVEAMQQSCPIIVSNKGGVTEIIDDGVDGFIADAYKAKDWVDKIERILNNQELADRLGYAAYESAYSKFSIANYVNGHDEMYKTLLI